MPRTSRPLQCHGCWANSPPAAPRDRRNHISKDSVMTISIPAGPKGHSRAVLTATLALLIVSAGPLNGPDKDPLVAKGGGVEGHQSDLPVAEAETRPLP